VKNKNFITWPGLGYAMAGRFYVIVVNGDRIGRGDEVIGNQSTNQNIKKSIFFCHEAQRHKEKS
jgi:hypothetical protein